MPKKLKVIPIESTTVDMEDVPEKQNDVPDANIDPALTIQQDVSMQPEITRVENSSDYAGGEIPKENVDNNNDSVCIDHQTPGPVMQFLQELNKDIEPDVKPIKQKVYEDCPICGKTMLKKKFKI